MIYLFFFLNWLHFCLTSRVKWKHWGLPPVFRMVACGPGTPGVSSNFILFIPGVFTFLGPFLFHLFLYLVLGGEPVKTQGARIRCPVRSTAQISERRFDVEATTATARCLPSYKSVGCFLSSGRVGSAGGPTHPPPGSG